MSHCFIKIYVWKKQQTFYCYNKQMAFEGFCFPGRLPMILTFLFCLCWLHFQSLFHVHQDLDLFSQCFVTDRKNFLQCPLWGIWLLYNSKWSRWHLSQDEFKGLETNCLTFNSFRQRIIVATFWLRFSFPNSAPSFLRHFQVLHSQ